MCREHRWILVVGGHDAPASGAETRERWHRTGCLGTLLPSGSRHDQFLLS